MALGVRAHAAPAPNTSAAVAAYLAPCVRDVDHDGDLDLLRITAGNWCAAFQSAALAACLLPGDEPPHEYRAGVVELVADAQARGVWHDVEEVRLGRWTPWLGDLVIWDRSNPADPATAWHRHVNRLTSYSPSADRFRTIGGNESGRRIVETTGPPRGLDASRLLGFVSYYQRPEAIVLDDDTRERNLRLIAAFVSEALRGGV